MNRPASVVPTNPVDAPIHGTHAGSSADKARQKVVSRFERDRAKVVPWLPCQSQARPRTAASDDPSNRRLVAAMTRLEAV